MARFAVGYSFFSKKVFNPEIIFATSSKSARNITTNSTSTEEYHLNTYELTEAQKDAFKIMYDKLQFSNLNLDKE